MVLVCGCMGLGPVGPGTRYTPDDEYIQQNVWCSLEPKVCVLLCTAMYMYIRVLCTLWGGGGWATQHIKCATAALCCGNGNGKALNMIKCMVGTELARRWRPTAARAGAVKVPGGGTGKVMGNEGTDRWGVYKHYVHGTSTL